MLQELLTLLSDEPFITPAMLARRLNTTPALVGLMLDGLEQAGYLREGEPGCGGCPGCGPRSGCQPSHPRFWVRTGKPFRSNPQA